MFSFVLLLPIAARAGTVTNLASGGAYASLQDAISDAAAGDTLELDGDLDESVVVDRDLTFVGTLGAHLHADTPEVIYLNTGVELVIDGVDLSADAATRVVHGGSGTADLTIRNATIQAPSVYAGVEGGVLYLINPIRLVLDHVTMIGTRGVDVASYGAVYVSGANAGAVEVTDSTFQDLKVSNSGGGALSVTYASVSCDRCVFDHTEGGWGGAIGVTYGTLVVQNSVFSACSGGLGGAVYGVGDGEILNSVFVENDANINGAAIYANDGVWTVRNNHFLGKSAGQSASELYVTSSVDAVEVRNNLFFGVPSVALDASAGPAPTVGYNYFVGNGTNADVVLAATNLQTSDDPQLVLWTTNSEYVDDDYHPLAVTSPLLDAGDPTIPDPDGSTSDIGAYGGVLADPAAFVDEDGDGATALWDCADDDAAVVDVVFYPDCDGDGLGEPTGAPVGCVEPADPPEGCDEGGWSSAIDQGELATLDCDDTDAAVYPGAAETCAPADQDCDGHPYTDAIDAQTWYLDLDGDRYGDTSFTDCAGSLPGWVLIGGDCDDLDGDVYPTAGDACGDYVDQDCDGADGTDEERISYYTDADRDGYGDPDADPVEACPGAFPEGLAANDDDCDDGEIAIHPGAFDTCDGVDQDCNGLPDDGPPIRNWYRDQDGDGDGGDRETQQAACSPGDGWVLGSGDCDDLDPGAIDCEAPEAETCGCQTTAPAPWLAAFLVPILALRRSKGGFSC